MGATLTAVHESPSPLSRNVSSARPLTSAGMAAACATLGVTPAEIWAILSVETRGFGFCPDRRPQVLFERHIFHRLTNGRYDVSHPATSNPVPGGYLFGVAEYARLESAMALNRTAAMSSTSWGLGQTMGRDFALAGFESVDAMVSAMTHEEDIQLRAVATFLHNSGLQPALILQDWPAFARGLNGPHFELNAYDKRLAAAHARSQVMRPDLGLRACQAALLYLGFNPGPVDGVPGRITRAAVTAFQKVHRLPTSGEIDPTTENTLMNAAFPE